MREVTHIRPGWEIRISDKCEMYIMTRTPISQASF